MRNETILDRFEKDYLLRDRLGTITSLHHGLVDESFLVDAPIQRPLHTKHSVTLQSARQ